MIIMLIPAQVDEPVRTEDPPTLAEVGRLVFGNDDTWFDFINVLPSKFQIGVDDIGAIRDPKAPLNERITWLAAHYGYGRGAVVPLYGNAVILGVNEMTGDWIDAPVEEIMTTLAKVDPTKAGA